MKTAGRHKIIIGSAFFLLLLGLINYLLFNRDILLFHFSRISFRENLNLSSSLQHFLTGYFSDITWCFALCLIVAIFSELKLIRSNNIKALILLLPFFTEVCQGLHIIHGTFDIYDIICYAAIIFSLSLFFPTLIFINMKKFKPQLAPVIVIIVFLGFAIASTPPRHYTYAKSKPLPCITHKGLAYSPVLVKFFISGSYPLKDLAGAQKDDPNDILYELNKLNANKYQLTSGQTPNLNLYVTYNSDNYQHYGATIAGYVYDGDFTFTLNTNYNSDDFNDLLGSGKIFHDIASKVNDYISWGWCKNCPSPCNP